jgi:hypothetical protein
MPPLLCCAVLLRAALSRPPQRLSLLEQSVCLPPACLPTTRRSARCAPAHSALRRGAACSVINDSLSEEATAEHDREHFWDVAASTGATQVGPLARWGHR